MLVVAEGLTLAELGSYEPLLAEGQQGEVRIYLDRILVLSEIQQIEDEILAQGVVLTDHIQSADGILVIPFQKMLAPLLIVGLVVSGILAVGTAIFGWQLLTNVQGIPIWIWMVGGAALLYLLFAKPAERVAGEAVKIYVGGKMGKGSKTRSIEDR